MNKRKKRLLKIRNAELSIENTLLGCRACKHYNWSLEDDVAWKNFYYLVALARKAK